MRKNPKPDKGLGELRDLQPEGPRTAQIHGLASDARRRLADRQMEGQSERERERESGPRD